MSCPHFNILVEPVEMFGASEVYINSFKATCLDCKAEASASAKWSTGRGQEDAVIALLDSKP